MKKTLYILAFAALCLASCNKEEEVPGGTYLRLGKGITEDAFHMDWKGTVYNGSTHVKFEEAFAVTDLCPRVELYSDVKNWSIVPRNEEDSEWLFFWPSSGNDCGLFFVTVDNNLMAEERSAVVDIKDESGKVWKSFTVNQTGSAPYLELNMGGLTDFNVASEQGSIEIKLHTNTLWEVTPDSDASGWISISDRSSDSFTVDFAQNTSDDSRSAAFVLSRRDQTENPITVNFTISQIGGKFAFSQASRTTIAGIKDAYPDEAVISDNLYFEGTVISDYAKLNIDEHYYSYTKDANTMVANISNVPMWIQDDEGNGICLEFITAGENHYAPGTRMKIHLAGQTIGRNEAGVLRIGGLSSAYVHDAVQGTEPVPVEVTDLSTLGNYEDRLVTLKNVQYAIPVGTYYNADTNYLTYVQGGFTDLVDATTRQFPIVIFDKHGNTARMMTASTFLDRFYRLIPEGTGDITGIVTRRYHRGGQLEFYIRMRSAEDDKVNPEKGADNARVLLRFGPYNEPRDADPLTSDEGIGTLKTSVFTKIKGASSSTTTMYWAFSGFFKNINRNVTKDQTPIKHEDASVYRCINAQNWYNATGTSIIDDMGEAWIVNTSSTGAGSGSLYVAFACACYSNGAPRYFSLEWSDDESTPTPQWHKVTTYEITSWSADWQMGEFMFRLPDEAKGLKNLVIRHRVSGTDNITGGKTISGCSSRMAYWALLEL